MTSENPVADRLLNDSRKKSARLESPKLAIAAMIVGVIGLIAGPFSPIVGWILGAVAVVMGVPGIQRPASSKLAKIAVVIGVAAILVATFFFTLFISK